MKKITILIFILFSCVSLAQNGGRIKQLKTAYITQELNLTQAEARQFWPVYDEYYDAIAEYRKDQIFQIIMDDDRDGNMTDGQAKKLLKDYIDTETTVYDAKIKMITDLKSILSEVKIAKLLIAEKEFNKRMLQRFRRNNR